MSASRPPDFKLGIMNKETGARNSRAGGAWIDEQTGYIRIVLDYGVVIPPNDPNVILTLFPNDRPPGQEPR
jgi:hypothetical protein